MVDVLVLLWSALTSLFRSRVRLEAEIPVLREQISVLRRTSPKRFAFGIFDRWVFVGLYRLVPGIVDALSIVRPETVIRWHPCWISIVLALEIQTARRETENPAGDTSANPGHEPGQPALGRTPHPRRTSHARHRCRPDKRCKVHGPEEGRAVTGLEDLSLQSRRRHRLDGLVRRADAFLPAAVRLPDLAAPSTSNHVAGGDGKPDGWMDCSTSDGGLWLGDCSGLYRSRSRLRL